MAMAADPYARGLFAANPYARSTAVAGRLVTVLDAHLCGRGLQLIKPISRALRRYDVHELILTDDPAAKPGGVVQRVWYAGFFEVRVGGMALVGAAVTVGGKLLGMVAGFDETHMPNHLNIVVGTTAPATGMQLGLALGDRVTLAGRGPESKAGSDE